LSVHTWFRFLPREPNYEACYALDVTAVQTGIVVERDATTGKLLGFKEVIADFMLEIQSEIHSLVRGAITICTIIYGYNT